MKRYKLFCLLLCISLSLCISSVNVFADTSSGSSSAVEEEHNWFTDGLKNLFVPSDDFFSNHFQRIHNRINSKFGGVINAYSALKSTLENFNSFQETSGVIKFNSGILAGKTFDFFNFDTNMLNIFRFGFSGFMVVFTVIYSIRRVIVLIRGGGSGV